MHALSYTVNFFGSYEERWSEDMTLTIAYSDTRPVQAARVSGSWRAVSGDEELMDLLNSEECPIVLRRFFEGSAGIYEAIRDCLACGLPLYSLHECCFFDANPYVAPEMLRILLDEHGIPINAAYKITTDCCADCRGSAVDISALKIIQPRTCALLTILRQCAAELPAVIHDSALPAYRSPFGAVKCGEALRLAFELKGGRPSAVFLELSGPGGMFEYPMERMGNEFFIEFNAPDTPAQMEYRFRLTCSDGDSFACPDSGGHRAAVYNTRAPGFILTVYLPDFETPEWFKRSIMYQIFPDRFAFSSDDTARRGIEYHLSLNQTPELHGRLDEEVRYLPRSFERSYSPDDFYGGTFRGIESKLPYLRSLGVGCLYLNPICEARSNHRYDTSDYLRPDPILGTEDDFRALCESAGALGIRIILDGVFSHTGADSIYFNRYFHYPSLGACSGENSPYYSWYDFYSFPDEYRSWWGFKELPEVDERNASWQDFVITGEDSVVKTWLRRGAAGWRLDVADELPDEVLSLIRAAVKSVKPDAPIIGEVWENAVTKEAYGVKRNYALGYSLDSVMNYPLRSAILDFLCNRSNAYKLRDFLISQKSDYPRPLYESLMNLLGSHDVERLLNALASDIVIRRLSREDQLRLKFPPERIEKARRLEKLAVALQFMLPGVPSIYYGDEQGMSGVGDPFNRRPFREQDRELYEYYVNITAFHNKSDILKYGDVEFKALNADTIVIYRYVNLSYVKLELDRARLTVTFSSHEDELDYLNII